MAGRMGRSAGLLPRAFPPAFPRTFAPVLAAAFAAYAGWACPYVLGGDNGEFATLFAEGGVAHPSGYPLYTLVLRALSGALSWVPCATPALGAARVSALIGTGAVYMLWRACRSWGASDEAAAVGAAVFALSGTAWTLSVQAEVFAMNALLTAAVADVAGPFSRARGGARVTALGLVMGLGLSHQHTILAMLPVVAIALWRTYRVEAARLRHAAFGLGALVLGLAPYAYTLWASHHAAGRWVWGDPMTLHDLLRHVRRSDYVELAREASRTIPILPELVALADAVARDLAWLPFGVGIAGAAWTCLRAGGDERRPARFEAAMLVASACAAGPGLVAMMCRSIGHTPMPAAGLTRGMVERFYLMPEILACVPVAWGVDLGLSRVSSRSDRPGAVRAARRRVAALLVLSSLAAGAWIGRPRVEEATRPTVEAYLLDTLHALPEGAVVVGAGDHRAFGVLYAQHALGIRRDVLYVDASLLGAAWYRRRLPIALDATSVSDVLAASLAAGRPTFSANDFEALAAFPHYASGTLIRVLPAGAPLPSLDEREALNAAFARTSHRPQRPPSDRWGWAGEADDAYARPWLELYDEFRRAGALDRARRSLVRASERNTGEPPAP